MNTLKKFAQQFGQLLDLQGEISELKRKKKLLDEQIELKKTVVKMQEDILKQIELDIHAQDQYRIELTVVTVASYCERYYSSSAQVDIQLVPKIVESALKEVI